MSKEEQLPIMHPNAAQYEKVLKQAYFIIKSYYNRHKPPNFIHSNIDTLANNWLNENKLGQWRIK